MKSSHLHVGLWSSLGDDGARFMGEPGHNLPTQPTPLIGREQAVASALQVLGRDDVRLLTVTGPAGVGKSRLAVATAGRSVPRFEHGAWFVDLATVESPPGVLGAIGRVLGVREIRDTPISASVRQHLADRCLLLVLDNFEHVLAAASAIGELLAACTRVKVLATSRAPLRLRWEHELPLASLDLPSPSVYEDPVALAAVPAVTLFVERARAIEPGFAVDARNAHAVADLCHQLDGLPLAIELAAARIRLLPPQAMLSRLSMGVGPGSLDLLATRARDMPARHQTLRAAIGWSHDLLTPDHRSLFRRLAVFVGGCTLAMAEAVCEGLPDAASADQPSLLDDLGTLVENHLLRQVEDVDGEPRFRMLATIREYAAERLDASGEAETVRRRHALTMLELARRAGRGLVGEREAESMALLEREYDNLRAALTYLAQAGEIERDDIEAGLRTSRVLWRFWSIRGHLADGRAWLTALLERDRATGPPSAARSLALSSAGWMALEQGDIADALALSEEGLAIARACEDPALEAEHLSQIGHAARQQGDYATAQRCYEESLALRRSREDRLGIAWSLRNLAHVARLRGEHEQSCALYEESLAVGGALAPRSEVAGTLGYLGNALLRRGDLDRAQARFAESLGICVDIGHRRRLAYALEGLAGVSAARGAMERALRIAGAATALRERIGAPLWPAGLAALEQRLGPARQRLGPARAAECWAAGRALSLDDAVAEAMGRDVPAPSVEDAVPSDGIGAASHSLTQREMEVVRQIVRGRTNRQIAEALVISEGTAAVHVKHILNKLGLDSRAQVAAWAVRRGLTVDAD
jgi:non-specific serine/threonine protein kinase